MLNSNRWSSVRRHVFWPLVCRFNGSPRLRYLKELERTQFLTMPELRQMQWERLVRLVRYAWENNAFYRQRLDGAGIPAGRIDCVEDMRNIPILTKEEIRNNSVAMISKGSVKEALLQFKTGGSTGKSLDIYITEECSELRNACALRHDRWAGWDVGDTVGAVWGNPSLPGDWKSKLQSWLLSPFIYLDTMSVSDESVLAFAREWEKVQPSLLFGHAHSLYLLAQYAQKLAVTAIRPKGIISTSMMLLQHERRLIEEIFQTQVTDRYGCEEVSLIGSECEQHNGMHLNIEHLYIEFIRNDGSPANEGELGEIVVTDLMNMAMPFIRYRVEDVGIPSDRLCACGRGLPLMESVTGRVADFLVKRDGSRVAGVSLIENTLTKIPGIDQMQLVQESIDSLVVRIVPGSAFGSSEKNDLLAYFTSLFGESMCIHLEMVEVIPAEPSGKYRFSICKVT